MMIKPDIDNEDCGCPVTASCSPTSESIDASASWGTTSAAMNKTRLWFFARSRMLTMLYFCDLVPALRARA